MINLHGPPTLRRTTSKPNFNTLSQTGLWFFKNLKHATQLTCRILMQTFRCKIEINLEKEQFIFSLDLTKLSLLLLYHCCLLLLYCVLNIFQQY